MAIIIPQNEQLSAILGVCKLFISFVEEDKYLEEITNQDVAKFRDCQLEEYRKSKKTVDLQLVAIRGFFRYAEENHDLSINPVQGVSVKRTKAESNREKRTVKRRPPTHQEADEICSAFPGDHRTYSNADFQDYAMFARYTGMRQRRDFPYPEE